MVIKGEIKMKKLCLAFALVLGLGPMKPAAADVVGAGPYVSPLPKVDGEIYAHVGPLNLTIPWQNVNVVYLYDFQSDRSLIGGEAVVASIWRIQATVGAVTSLAGNGSPFVGGNIWFPNPVPQIAILNEIKPGVFGGWDWTEGHSIFGVKAAYPIF